MSAPDTSLVTQKRRHRGPLIGMALAAIFGVSLILYWLMEESATASDPQPTGTQIEGAPTSNAAPDAASNPGADIRRPDAPATGPSTDTTTNPQTNPANNPDPNPTAAPAPAPGETAAPEAPVNPATSP